jgi:hypothetical protein
MIDKNKEIKRAPTLKKNKARTKTERKYDMEREAQLMLQGMSNKEIAKVLTEENPYNVSPHQVAYDRKAIEAEWRRSTLIDFNQVRNKELARIDTLEAEYWRAWYKSWEEITEKQQEAKTTDTESTGKSRGGKETEQSQRKIIQERLGDVKYLNGVQWCIEQRIKIFGLNAPDKHEVDWRLEAKKFGIPEEAISEQFNEMVEFFVNSPTSDGSDDEGSDQDSETETEE